MLLACFSTSSRVFSSSSSRFCDATTPCSSTISFFSLPSFASAALSCAFFFASSSFSDCDASSFAFTFALSSPSSFSFSSLKRPNSSSIVFAIVLNSSAWWLALSSWLFSERTSTSFFDSSHSTARSWSSGTLSAESSHHHHTLAPPVDWFSTCSCVFIRSSSAATRFSWSLAVASFSRCARSLRVTASSITHFSAISFFSSLISRW